MRIAYADPPYIGCAKRYEEQTEVDHKELLIRLIKYDGWALSCSSPSLKVIIPMLNEITDDYRIGIWVKPFCVFKPNVNPAYAYEPVIFKSAREGNREINTIRDWVSCNITLKRGLVGVKPETFSFWLFQILGMEKDDEFDDLFIGTGAVTDSWHKWRKQILLKV